MTLNTPAAEFAPHGARPVWVYLTGGLHASESIALCIDRNDNDIITSMRCESISKTSTQQGRAGVEGGWRPCGMYFRDCVRAEDACIHVAGELWYGWRLTRIATLEGYMF